MKWVKKSLNESLTVKTHVCLTPAKKGGTFRFPQNADAYLLESQWSGGISKYLNWGLERSIPHKYATSIIRIM